MPVPARFHPAAIVCVLLLALGPAGLAGCATKTTLSGVWNSESASEPIQSTLIIGIGIDATSRRQYEDHFAAALEARGTRAVPSYRVLPKSDKLTRDEVAQAIERGGHDALIITRLLAVDKDQTYVPPTSSMSLGMGTGYYGYYGSAFGVNYSPGYVQTTTIVRLETRLYTIGADDLVWSAQSDTFDPSKTQDAVESVVKAVTTRMEEDGWLRPAS